MRSMAMLFWGAVFLVCGQFALAQNVEYCSSTLWSEISDLKASGNYAYCAFANGLAVLDVSDMSVPVLHSQEFLPGYGYGIDVVGSYAYIADGDSGLQIIDISDPANPEFVGGYQTPGTAMGIFVFGNYAYLACENSGVQIVDILDKTNPIPVAGLDTPGSALRIFVAGGFAYVADGDSGLQIINVSDPSNPAPAGSYQSQYEANDVWISGDYAFLGTGDCPWSCYGGLEVLDISNPNYPLPVGIFQINQGIFRFFESNNHLFISHLGSGGGGVLILDISDPHAPIFIYDYISQNYYRPVAIFVAGDHAVVGWNSWDYMRPGQYIETVDISDLQYPVHIGTYDVPYKNFDLSLSNNYAFVTNYDAGLQIVDISDPAAPVVTGHLETDGTAYYVYGSGSYAFVTSLVCGISDCEGWCDIVDITDAYNPAIVSPYSEYCQEYGGSYFYDVTVSGDYAYNVYGCGGISYILIWNISNPQAPVRVGEFSAPGARRIFKAGDLLYISSWINGLSIENVSNPASPFFVGNCDTPGEARDVYVSGDYAYVADGSAGLQIVNVSDPTQPAIVGNRDTPDSALGVVVSSDYAYLALRRSGIQVIDISDPLHPNLAGSYDSPGYARAISVSGDYIYLADYYNLMILRFNPQTGIEDIGDLPRQLALNQNYPNPFNASTKIEFDIPALSNINISVYDILGRRVTTLFAGQKRPGSYSINWIAEDVPSGIYFARLRTGSRSDVIRMTLLK